MFDQAFCRSTETEVGRPTRSTDVHKRAQPVWLEGRSTDPVDRQRALFSGSGLGRLGGRPAESFCFLYPGLGRTTVGNLTVGRSIGQSTDSRISY